MKKLLLLLLFIPLVSFGQTAQEYYDKGKSYFDLDQYYNAISDFDKAIELDPDYTGAYVNRGLSKELINDLNGACADWKKAANMGHTNSVKWVANQCN